MQQISDIAAKASLITPDQRPKPTLFIAATKMVSYLVLLQSQLKFSLILKMLLRKSPSISGFQECFKPICFMFIAESKI